MPDKCEDYPSSGFTFLDGTEPKRDSVETEVGDPRTEVLAKAREMLASAAEDVGFTCGEFSVQRSTAKVNLARAYMELADRLGASDA